MKEAMRRVAKEEVGKHVKAMHKGKKFYAGGKTDADMLSMGRGLAKVRNQETGMKKP
jgi:hypothetical protein